MSHTVKDFSIANEAERDVFLEFLYFLHDAMNGGNLISGSSVFSKPTLYIWKFLVQVLLKPCLKDFEHNLTIMWNECNCVVVGIFFCTALIWGWNKTNIFQSCGHCCVCLICWHIECSTLTASSFRIVNSSAGIPSTLLVLFLLMLLKAYLISHSRMSGSRSMTTSSWLFL